MRAQDGARAHTFTAAVPYAWSADSASSLRLAAASLRMAEAIEWVLIPSHARYTVEHEVSGETSTTAVGTAGKNKNVSQLTVRTTLIATTDRPTVKNSAQRRGAQTKREREGECVCEREKTGGECQRACGATRTGGYLGQRGRFQGFKHANSLTHSG